MKYGNFKVITPDFTKQIEEMAIAVENGEMTEKEFKATKEKFRKLRLSYIVATNGGYTPPSKKNRQKKTIVQRRQEFHDQKVHEITERLKNEEEIPPEFPE